MAYRVTAPYVTVRVADQAGAETVIGVTGPDAALPSNVVVASLEHLLRKGMVVEEPEPKAEAKVEPKAKATEPEAKGK